MHEPTHFIVLNKYPVIPQHFILATISYKEQTQLLEVEDLQVTFACLKAWAASDACSNPTRRLFAFFNSGEHSGASQSHRHVLLLRESEGGRKAADRQVDTVLAHRGDGGRGDLEAINRYHGRP